MARTAHRLGRSDCGGGGVNGVNDQGCTAKVGQPWLVRGEKRVMRAYYQGYLADSKNDMGIFCPGSGVSNGD